MRKIPFCDKDALGREKNHQKWVLLRDTCDYPTTSNAHFTRVSEPKLSDDMKENEKLIVLRDTELIFVMKNVLFIIVVWLLLIQPMKEKKKWDREKKQKNV